MQSIMFVVTFTVLYIISGVESVYGDIFG